ncbi:HAD family hydrolase [Paenibacillus rhizovicinus]|uniref:HAD family hydrolase n=1 Tax=Paenibacillus rhizovicinus TaxID=2704463 RepID=UPI001CDBE026|nr:HAD family phosphatase [Paenibacillus rhizovicinus]
MAWLYADGERFPIEAILFDKDGTLLDFIYTWGKWSERVFTQFAKQLEARNLPPMDVDLSALWGTRHDRHGEVVDYDRNGVLSMGTVEDLMITLAWQGHRLGMTWAEAKEAAYASRQYAEEQLDIARDAKALPGVVEFLEQCRGCGLKLAVVTADETSGAVKHLEWLGLERYFDVIIGTDQVERGKPFPDMAMLACRRLGVTPAQAAVIGDTNGDMRMARSAGAFVTIGIAKPDASSVLQLPDADKVIASFHELRLSADER